MSYIADDWSLGTLPLQHLDYKKEKQLPLDLRHVVYGCRMGRRKIDEGDLGHYVVEPGSAGDVIGAYLWRTASESLRPISAWSFAWPSVVSMPTASTTTGGSSGSTSASPTVLPIFNSKFQEDQRFEHQTPGTPSGTCYPKAAGGSVGVMLDATDETAQDGVFLSTDPRLVAVNAAGDPDCSSIVTDLDSNSRIAGDRCARLHTFLRVVRPVSGVVNFSTTEHALAWQIGKSGQDKIEGFGLVYDDAAGTPVGTLAPPPQTIGYRSGTGSVALPPVTVITPSLTVSQGVVAACSSRVGGFIDVGDSNDKHQIGKTLDGEPVNSAHISTLACFRGHGGDGPMYFEPIGAAQGSKWPFLSQVHFGFDQSLPYAWNGKTLAGKWRWWSYTMLDLVGEGGGGGGGGGEITPPPPTGGGDEITPGGGGAPSSTPTPEQKNQLEIENLDKRLGSKFRKRTKGEAHEPFGGATLPLGVGALLVRPQDTLHPRVPDLRKQVLPPRESLEEFRDFSPVTMRMEGFTQQTNSTEPIYNEKPSHGRYRGGTASGGSVVMPPEVDIVDALDPTYTHPTDASTPSLVFLPEARLSFGLPDPSTGGVRTGGAEVYSDAADLRVQGARMSVDQLSLQNDFLAYEEISANAIATPTKSNIKLETEGGSATDYLDSIGYGTDGDILVLSLINGSHRVQVRAGIDNISLDGGINFRLVSIFDRLTLMSAGMEGWVELSRSTNS